MANTPDPMFDGIVKGSQEWHQHQQDIAHLDTGVDPDKGDTKPDKDS